jgi:glucose/arabinose dehydrogenase
LYFPGRGWHASGFATARMTSRLLPLLLLLGSFTARAAVLPGFSVKFLGPTSGFASSIAVDSKGTIYYTTTKGDILRFAPNQSTVQSALVAHLNTVADGDSGLLGMALRDDHTAAVHYTTPLINADVISLIDLDTGSETILHSFTDDPDFAGRSVPPEHHGGNPTVAPDGSVFVGIGDFNDGFLAPDLHWIAGKIWRVHPDGTAELFARGFRNPFDMWWDDAHQRLIATDNGVSTDDEINVVTAGGDYGWPFTMGNGKPVDGTVPPVYSFPMVIAPTGLLALSGRNPILRRGFLLGAFVTSAIYYIPDIDARPLPAPIALVAGEAKMMIDLAEGPAGEIYFVTGSGVYQLTVPARGDCNGDGLINGSDYDLLRALVAGGPRLVTTVSSGAVQGTWGCDVDGDGVVDGKDVAMLLAQLHLRARAVR